MWESPVLDAFIRENSVEVASVDPRWVKARTADLAKNPNMFNEYPAQMEEPK